MSDNGAKAPTSASTSPMGNTKGTTPTPLQRDVSPFARQHAKHVGEGAAWLDDVLRRKRTQSGHAHE